MAALQKNDVAMSAKQCDRAAAIRKHSVIFTGRLPTALRYLKAFSPLGEGLVLG
jgi:hypothetical protein